MEGREMKEIFRNVPKGTKLWSSQYGPVVVVGVSAKFVDVERYGKKHCYYLDGKFYNNSDVPQSLFWAEVKIEAPERPNPELCEACRDIDNIETGGWPEMGSIFRNWATDHLKMYHCTCEA
jgi:hypothetical protein